MKKVAVIGAGMAGLVSARELEKEGHQVTVFEKSNRVGGLWVYDPMVESDLLGLDPNREIVHSSVYKSLRVNIPRQLMCFLDYPFLTKDGGDSRSFPGHEEVLRYLEDFARDFGLYKFIRFGHEVVLVEPVDGAGKEWTVGWRTMLGQVGEEIFQAVVVCNGKYTEPKLADFPGRDSWPGTQLHSHNYRTPEPFKDTVVVVIGNGPSAWDIMMDICNVAKDVYNAKRPSTLKLFAVDLEKRETKWQKRPMIDHVLEDGKVVFEDKSFVYANVIIHCTGYNIHYPFLRTNGRVTVEDNCVGPLYKHIFPPSLAPGLSFVGLPWLSIPPIVFELQAKWIARVLFGKVNLPTEEEMTSSVQEFYHDLEMSGIPKHHAHRLRQQKWEYENWLNAQMGEPPLEKQKEQVFFALFGKIILCYGREFRDILDIDEMIHELEFPESSN